MKAYKVNMVNPDKTLVSVCELNPSDISMYDWEFTKDNGYFYISSHVMYITDIEMYEKNEMNPKISKEVRKLKLDSLLK